MTALDYVGRNAQGQVVCWCSADSGRKDLARTVSGWIRDGLDVERMSTEEAKAELARTIAARKAEPKQEEMGL